MVQRGGLARLKGWPLVVIFGVGLFSCVGFIWAAVSMRSRRWTAAALITTVLTVLGWVLMGTWQHGGEASNGAVAYVIEMWIAFVAFAWVVSKDYEDHRQSPPMPLTLPLPPGAVVTGTGRPAISPAVLAPPRSAPQWTQWTPPSTPIRDSAAGPRRRTPPACPVPPGLDVTNYTPRQLGAVLDWISSDGVMRTREELLTEFLRTLGYARRGSRIIAAFDVAYRSHQS